MKRRSVLCMLVAAAVAAPLAAALGVTFTPLILFHADEVIE